MSKFIPFIVCFHSYVPQEASLGNFAMPYLQVRNQNHMLLKWAT